MAHVLTIFLQTSPLWVLGVWVLGRFLNGRRGRG